MTDAKVNIERELELIDGMIEVQLHHSEQCDRIANRTMAEKQKGWDLERVALLRKMRAALAAQPADAQFEDDLIESVGQMQRGEVARVWQPAEPVAWLWRLNHSGKAFFMVADSTLREVLTDAFPVYAAPPAPAAVPPGWKLVPIEPTPGMIASGAVALMKASHSDLDCTTDEIAAAYRAMIAAAGEPSHD